MVELVFFSIPRTPKISMESVLEVIIYIKDLLRKKYNADDFTFRVR
jgi:hypothetical protein